MNGRRLEVTRYGPPPDKAPTLVFLHEGLGCVAMWRDFPAKLAAATGCGALVYSRLGYGLSDPCNLPRPVRFMHDEGLLSLPDLIEAAGIRKCILIGHSDGGSIAIIYGGGTPAHPLHGLITEAAHVFCEEVTLDSIRKAKTQYLKGDLKAKLTKYHGTNTENAFWGWNDVWLHPDFIDWNIESYLSDIRVPILAIQGEDDQYGSLAQIDSITELAGAGTEKLILKNCRHSPHRQQEARTFNAMLSFISRVFGKSDATFPHEVT